jgi:hypothetical protein
MQQEPFTKSTATRVFMKRPERGLQAALCVTTAKSREIFRHPCITDAEAA